MVWQTSTHSKNTNSDNNLTTTTTTSLSSSIPNTSSTINHSKSSSNKRSPSPRPPPRFHRPTPKSSPRSDSHHNDNNNTFDYSTLPNDVPFSMTPAGRFFTHFFDEAMQYFNYPMHDIIWSDKPPTINAYHGNSTNEKIIDNDEKYSIEIDLSDFLANELSISYDEDERELLVEGHQKGRNSRLGSIERNFKRKFDIPIDVHDGSLAAYLIPSGLLNIQAFKKDIKQPIRRIPIQEVSDIPDIKSINTTKVPTFENAKNTTNKTNVAPPPVPPKPTKVSESQQSSTYDDTIPKNSKIKKDLKIQKFNENDEKEENFDKIQHSLKKSDTKREYLNIFC